MMGDQKKRVWADGAMVTTIMRRLGISDKMVKGTEGNSIDGSTVTKAKKGLRLEEGSLQKLAQAFNVPIAILIRTQQEEHTWDDMVATAKVVSRMVFKKPYKADAVLTYAGPASIFAGLIVAFRPLGQRMRTPVYTAILSRSTKKPPEGYFCINEGEYCIFIPRAIKKHDHLVVVVETVTNGGAMRALQNYFENKTKIKVEFVCWMYYEGAFKCGTDRPKMPKFIRQQRKMKEPKEMMPWGIDNFSFLDSLDANPNPGVKKEPAK